MRYWDFGNLLKYSSGLNPPQQFYYLSSFTIYLSAMYSILKTQKKCILHKKHAPPLACAFLTDSHILLSFPDSTIQIYFLSLSQKQLDADLLIHQANLETPVHHIGRLSSHKCILLHQKCAHITFLSLKSDEHEQFKVKTQPVQTGVFPKAILNNANSSLFNLMGGSLRLHTFPNNCFCIQYSLFIDRKILFDCYRLNEPQVEEEQFGLVTHETDLQVNGDYVCEVCDQGEGEFAIYKQNQIDESHWEIKIFKPFSAAVKGSSASQESPNYEQVIRLPPQHFNEQIQIFQILKWFDGEHLISLKEKDSGLSRVIRVVRVEQNYHISYLFQPSQFQILKQPQPIRITHVDFSKEIFYTITHSHQRIDGELYENVLQIGNMRSGTLIQNGYCTLKNYSLSPNGRLILDMPEQLSCLGEIFFHIRVLLSKSTLYMFLIEKSPFSEINDPLKQTILSLLE